MQLAGVAPALMSLFPTLAAVSLIGPKVSRVLDRFVEGENALYCAVVAFLAPTAFVAMDSLAFRTAKRRPGSQVAGLTLLATVLLLVGSLLLLCITGPELMKPWISKNAVRYAQVTIVPVPVLCAVLYSVAVEVAARKPSWRLAAGARALLRNSFAIAVAMACLLVTYVEWMAPAPVVWDYAVRTLPIPIPFAILYYVTGRMPPCRLATAFRVLTRDLLVLSELWLAIFLSWVAAYASYCGLY